MTEPLLVNRCPRCFVLFLGEDIVCNCDHYTATPILRMTVGLPRTGKSTWACKQRQGQPPPIVNPDSIRLALHGKPFISSAESFVWAIAKTMVRSLFLAGHLTVILDATNTTRKRRDEWKSIHWSRRFHLFGGPESLDGTLSRVHEACDDVEHFRGLVEATKRMADEWEDVSLEEIQEA